METETHFLSSGLRGRERQSGISLWKYTTRGWPLVVTWEYYRAWTNGDNYMPTTRNLCRSHTMYWLYLSITKMAGEG